MKALLVVLLTASFLFSTVSIAHAKKPSSPSASWNKGHEIAFMSMCRAKGQTKQACECGLNKLKASYTPHQVIRKLFVPSLISRHLVPEAKAIFDSCGGRWDSLQKKKK